MPATVRVSKTVCYAANKRGSTFSNSQITTRTLARARMAIDRRSVAAHTASLLYAAALANLTNNGITSLFGVLFS